jgi:hypothetical protein
MTDSMLDENTKNRILDRIGAYVEMKAKMICPVDMGVLRASITHKIEGDSVIIFTPVEYAKDMEYGCFFKDVSIQTIRGKKKLSKMKIGDLVWDGVQYRKVLQLERIKIGYPIKKIIIKTARRKLEVTADHPIWTQRGWIPAVKIRRGELVKEI